MSHCVCTHALKYMMVVLTPRWKYTLMLVPKRLVPYFSRNAQLPNTFNPIAYYSKKFNNMRNKITQLWIIKCWLSRKLCGISDHIFMARSLLCIQTIASIDILSCTQPNQSLCQLHDELIILLIFFCGVVFSALRDPQTSFQMLSLRCPDFLTSMTTDTAMSNLLN